MTGGEIGIAPSALASWLLAVTSMLEQTRALSNRMVPDVRDGCRALPEPASSSTARLGALGLWHDPGWQRLPERGDRRLARGWALARPAPTPARVALRWPGQGGCLPDRDRRHPVLRSAHRLDSVLVAGTGTGAGNRPDRPGRPGGWADGECPLPRGSHPDCLAHPASQPERGLDGADPAPAPPGASADARQL